MGEVVGAVFQKVERSNDTHLLYFQV
jgi:hypothetical protein